MLVFLDFEATQFSNEIISIGCVMENGKFFSSLVRPKDIKHVTAFITELTGITREMLEDAPTSEEAFNHLYDFIRKHGDNTLPKYICYGNTDAGFLMATANRMTDVNAYTFVTSIAHTIKDYSPEVRKFFASAHNIGLRKVYNLVKSEEEVQKHDALEDAMMLAEVFYNLREKCSPEDRAIIEAMPKQPRPGKTKAPQMYLDWPDKKWDADTRGTADNWEICAKVSDHVKYFDNLETAALWAIKYLVRGHSPKNQRDINSIKKTITAHIQNGKTFCSFNWYSYDQKEKMNDC